jgi:hypothetical protein
MSRPLRIPWSALAECIAEREYLKETVRELTEVLRRASGYLVLMPSEEFAQLRADASAAILKGEQATK